MVRIGLVVPTLLNFKGLAEMFASVDTAVCPYVIDNWNTNRGVAGGWNEGIRRGWHEDVLVIVNDDVVFHPGTIHKLRTAIRVHNYDLVSAVATDTGEVGYHEDGFPDFCCFAIQPYEFVEKFGWFDERFNPAYFEDNDMSYRIRLGGGRQALRLDARVDHVGSVTNLKGGTNPDDRIVSHDEFRSNRKYYITKWGGGPREEKYTAPFDGITGKTFKDT